MLALVNMLGGLAWNPTIRGFLFPGIMFLILCGSSYLLLYTNVGNRLGFLIAASALAGWFTLMTVAWLLYGIGMKGTAAHWAVKEHLVGTTANAQYRPIANLKKGWKVIPEGSPTRSDAQATADSYLAPALDSGKRAPTSLFTSATEYQPVAAYERGGDNQLFSIRKHRFFLRHSPHWFVVQVQPFAKVPLLGKDGKPDGSKTTIKLDATKKAVVDPKAPTVSVVMVRDLGTQRQPPFVLFLCSAILFGVCVTALHRRDKAVMAHVKANPQLART